MYYCLTYLIQQYRTTTHDEPVSILFCKDSNYFFCNISTITKTQQKTHKGLYGVSLKKRKYAT